MENKNKHICFVIHGIGEACGMLKPIEECADEFQKMSEKILNNQQKEYLHISVEFVPITWHKIIHDDQDRLRWNHITLPNLEKMRLYFNTAFSDIIFYSNDETKQKILNEVKEHLNKAMNSFKIKNSNCKFSIIGHSLGSLIIFDLLSDENNIYKLDFEFEHFFAIGSPISYFLTIRGKELKSYNVKLDCNYFYNIFHELDPFAYRIEPMISRNPIKKAVSLNDLKGFNWLSFVQIVADSTNSFNYQSICRKKTDSSKEEILSRIDFILEKKFIDSLNYFCFFDAHSSYWKSEPLVLFVLLQLHRHE